MFVACQNFLGIGLYTALSWTPQEMEAANPSKIMQAHGLSKAEIQKEMALLNNALDYHNQTHRIDVAYEGFFFEKDLNTTRQIVEYTKPVSLASTRTNIGCFASTLVTTLELSMSSRIHCDCWHGRSSGLSTLSCSTRGKHGWRLSVSRPTRRRGGIRARHPMY